MPSDKPDVKWLADQTVRIVLAAVDMDSATAADALGDVAERYGWRGIYFTCCALAEAIVTMGDHRESGEGFYGFEVQHLDGGVVSPDDVDDDARDVLQGMRFVMACLNEDAAQRLALFDAPQTPEQAMDLPVGLIKLVSAYGRNKLAERGGTPDATV